MPNMASLTLMMSRPSIDSQWVLIQGLRQIRQIITITWRLAQKIEIMTIPEVAAQCYLLVPGGTTDASTPISTEDTWANNIAPKELNGIILDMTFHSNSLK